MTKQLEFDACAKALDNPEILNIFGEFQIDSHHYLVIRLERCVKGCYPLTACTCQSKFDLPEVGPEVGRFEINGQLCAVVKANQQPNQTDLDLASLLTQRELQIATLVAMGRPNKQIAHQLHISEWTVSTHLRRIFVKLKVESRAAMVYQCASLIQELHRLEGAE